MLILWFVMDNELFLLLKTGKKQHCCATLTNTEEHLSHPFINHFLVLYCVESKETSLFSMFFVC